jgi:hypothetical protein
MSLGTAYQPSRKDDIAPRYSDEPGAFDVGHDLIGHAHLAGRPVVPVPTITLDGHSGGIAPATDGMAHAGMFSGRRSHGIICDVGQKPLEAPEAFAQAVTAGAGQVGIPNSPFGSPKALPPDRVQTIRRQDGTAVLAEAASGLEHQAKIGA